MVRLLWIPNPGVPGSRPRGGSKVDSTFHPSEVDKLSIKNSLGLVTKSKLSPCNSSINLRQMNPIHKKEPINYFSSLKITCNVCLLRPNTPLLVT